MVILRAVSEENYRLRHTLEVERNAKEKLKRRIEKLRANGATLSKLPFDEAVHLRNVLRRSRRQKARSRPCPETASYPQKAADENVLATIGSPSGRGAVRVTADTILLRLSGRAEAEVGEASNWNAIFLVSSERPSVWVSSHDLQTNNPKQSPGASTSCRQATVLKH